MMYRTDFQSWTPNHSPDDTDDLYLNVPLRHAQSPEASAPACSDKSEQSTGAIKQFNRKSHSDRSRCGHAIQQAEP